MKSACWVGYLPWAFDICTVCLIMHAWVQNQKLVTKAYNQRLLMLLVCMSVTMLKLVPVCFFSCLRLISRIHKFPKIFFFYKNNALYKLSLMRHNLHWIPLLLFFPVGYYSGGLGGHHVLCYGCSLLLQFHLLHPPDNSEWLWAELGRPGLVYESITWTVTEQTYRLWCNSVSDRFYTAQKTKTR